MVVSELPREYFIGKISKATSVITHEQEKKLPELAFNSMCTELPAGIMESFINLKKLRILDC